MLVNNHPTIIKKLPLITCTQLFLSTLELCCIFHNESHQRMFSKFSHFATTRTLLSAAEAGGVIVLVEDNSENNPGLGKAVGIVLFTFANDFTDELLGYTNLFYIHPHYRNKKNADLLMQTLIQRAKKHNVVGLYATATGNLVEKFGNGVENVRDSNERAFCMMAQRNGFKAMQGSKTLVWKDFH